VTTRTECVDVCIVGSGAGGSVVAHHAAARGLRTLVLERGPRVAPEQFTHSELDMLPWLYKDGGMQFNTAMDLFVLQGSCVGGSTVLSNMVMVRPGEDAFRAWANFGAEYEPARLDGCFDEVAAELQVQRAHKENVSRSSLRYLQGARALGLSPEWMLKALGDCRGCGYCNSGCSFGAKRDASQTYLRWAEQAGARVLADAEAVRLCHSRGLVDGVEVRQGRAGDRLRVRARVVVVCAGAIGSSALLLRSGIARNIGTRLSFNAGGMVVADFDQPLDAYDADQMTLYLRGPGYLVEVTHNPPMAAALTTPGWFHDHARLMARSRCLAYAGALVPTAATGSVVWSPWSGHEETRFRMSPRELRTLKQGMRSIAEVFFEAGAKQVFLPTHRWCALRSPAELGSIDAAFSQSRELSLGSAHPQGGNPISADPRLGAVDASLRVHDFENLFVCDASVFPSCIGVNPIHTIMALAKLASGGIVAEA
jgi:choline dehydrogenase-like flavoprotein